MKSIKLLSALALSVSSFVFSQDDLMNKLKNNASQDSKFDFTITKELGNTPVKNQGSSGTCWSYSGNSFIESEMIRKGQKKIDIAEIFTARNSYLDKAKLYVLNGGAISWGDGGELHDVINMYKKYGALPQEVYSGLKAGQTKNDFSEMQGKIKPVLDSLVEASKKGKLSDNWLDSVSSILDEYLGKVPQNFMYNGKNYTPKSFANEVVNIQPSDYVELSSYKDYPYYQKFVVPIPDNWSHDSDWNVPMNDLTKIIDYALNNGYTVGWATDVSEPYFSYRNGVAYVPNLDLNSISPEVKKELFTEPKADKEITEDMRQTALNNLSTTDDHGMHIIGFAKDQNGKEYYVVKNSWGVTNEYQGYIFVTKPYVLYKTTAILVHKNGIPKSIKKLLKLNKNIGL